MHDKYLLLFFWHGPARLARPPRSARPPSASPQAIAGRAWQEGGRCEALRAGFTDYTVFC